jgi:DNA-binding NarL/FixJ family response regulator
MKQVLIIEDHPMVAQAMLGQLARADSRLQLELSGEAASARTLLFHSAKEWFRVFLDLDIPGAYGLSLAREIHRAGLHGRCCVVTALNRRDLIDEARSLGFLGYIVKALPYVEFEIALARVLKGELTFPQADLHTHFSTRLTRRQEQLLDLVRRGLSSKEIARAVSLSEGSVNNCINAAMKVLQVNSRSHAVAKALELGLLPMSSSGTPIPTVQNYT